MMTACYGPSPAEDAGTRIIDEDWPREGSTASYVVGEVTIPDAPAGAGMNVVPGLNVDAKVSDGTAPTDCEDDQPPNTTPPSAGTAYTRMSSKRPSPTR